MKERNEYQWKCAIREAEIGNEVGTDEYRETQPWKGVTELAEDLDCSCQWMNDHRDEVCRAAGAWLIEYGMGDGSYAGTDQCAILLNLLFDHRWSHGKTLYYDLAEAKALMIENDKDDA